MQDYGLTFTERSVIGPVRPVHVRLTQQRTVAYQLVALGALEIAEAPVRMRSRATVARAM